MLKVQWIPRNIGFWVHLGKVILYLTACFLDLHTGQPFPCLSEQVVKQREEPQGAFLIPHCGKVLSNQRLSNASTQEKTFQHITPSQKQHLKETNVESETIHPHLKRRFWAWKSSCSDSMFNFVGRTPSKFDHWLSTVSCKRIPYPFDHPPASSLRRSISPSKSKDQHATSEQSIQTQPELLYQQSPNAMLLAATSYTRVLLIPCYLVPHILGITNAHMNVFGDEVLWAKFEEVSWKGIMTKLQLLHQWIYHTVAWAIGFCHSYVYIQLLKYLLHSLVNMIFSWSCLLLLLLDSLAAAHKIIGTNTSLNQQASKSH